MYIYIYLNTTVCVYIYIYVFMYVCMYVCLFVCMCVFLRLGHFVISGHLSWMLYRRTVSDASWSPAVAGKTSNSVSFHRFLYCSGIRCFQFFKVICTSCLLRHLQLYAYRCLALPSWSSAWHVACRWWVCKAWYAG